MSRSFRKVELDALEKLPIQIPDYKGKSHPFSRGAEVKVYTRDELRKEAREEKDRTDWFEKRLFAIWKEIGRPVPYAFVTASGEIRSLDAGCLGFLLKLKPPRLIVYSDPKTSEITSVEPTVLPAHFSELERRLRNEVRISISAGISSSANAATTTVDGDIREFGFNLDDPIDKRRIQLSKQVIRDGTKTFRTTR